MIRRILYTIGILISLPLFFAAALLLLSELGEVVVIRTSGHPGAQETRIWVVDVPDGILVRGSSGKTWVEAARHAPEIELRRAGDWHRYAVIEQSGPEAQQRINELMREKYGIADRLTEVLRDPQRAVPLLLASRQ